MVARYLGLVISILGISLLIAATLSTMGWVDLDTAEKDNEPIGLEFKGISYRLRKIERSVKLIAERQTEANEIQSSSLKGMDEKSNKIISKLESLESNSERQTEANEIQLSSLKDLDGKSNKIISKLESLESNSERQTELDTEDTGPDRNLRIRRLEKQINGIDGKLSSMMEQLNLNREKSTSRACSESRKFRLALKPMTVYFNSDSANLEHKAIEKLDEVMQVLLGCNDIVLLVEGHTDSTGSVSYNKALALRRIDAVYQYLVSLGIGSNRFVAIPQGEHNPVTTNATLEGRAANRRVVLTMKFIGRP